MELRFQVDDEYIKNLRAKLGYSSNTDLARDALTLLNWAADESEQGRVILSAEQAGGTPIRLALAKLDEVRARSRR